MHVWGSLGCLQTGPSPSTIADIQAFLQQDSAAGGKPELDVDVAARLARIGASLTPDQVLAYHRHQARIQVAGVWQDFKRIMSSIEQALHPAARDDGLCSTTLRHLLEVEEFTTTLYRFFKCTDEMCAGGPEPMAGGDANSSRLFLPSVGGNSTGYVVCTEGGHGGTLSLGEEQHLGLHLRSAAFGKFGTSAGVGLACGP